VVWNASDSVPIGLSHATGKLMVNDLVIAMPPGRGKYIPTLCC
jgi:hypothetical protein